jgi:hypothetical protein
MDGDDAILSTPIDTSVDEYVYLIAEMTSGPSPAHVGSPAISAVTIWTDFVE